MSIRVDHKIGLMGVDPCNSNGKAFTTVQAAIDDLNGNGWVYVPTGTWDERLTVDENYVELFGCGWDAIINQSTETGHAITWTGTHGIIKDLQCGTAPGGLNAYDAINSSGDFLRIQNVFVNGADNRGIYTTGGDTVITDCYVYDPDSDGILCEGVTLISGCYFLQVGGVGIYLGGSGDLSVVIGNHVHTTGDDGILIAPTAETCTVIGNQITAWTNEPIDDDSATSTVYGNNCGGPVMNSLGCSHATVQDAIDHVEAYGSGGWIEVPAGTWAEALTIEDDDIQLRGLGRGSLIQPGGAAGPAVTISGDYDDVIIRDLAVDTKTGSSGDHCIVIEDGADYFRVENVIVVDSDDSGIRIRGTTISGGWIVNCTVLSADAQGIYVNMDAANNTYYFNISDNHITGCGSDGISFDVTGSGSSQHIISGNTIRGNTGSGLELGEFTYSVVTDNNIWNNTLHGINLINADYNNIIGNNCRGNDSGNSQTYDGINIDSNSYNNTVVGNVCSGNNTQRHGIIASGIATIISGNYCDINDYSGIVVDASDCIVNGNKCYDNGQHAAGTYHEILLEDDADRCVVSNNHCASPGDSSEDCIHLNDGATQAQIVGNYCYNGMGSGIALTANNDDCGIYNNYCSTNDDYGIEITAATCNNTRVFGNSLIGNVTGQMLDSGTDTELPTITVPFVDGSDPQTSGFEIDIGGEFARAYAFIPLEVQQVLRMKIYARSVVLEAHAMHLEVNMNAGASNEAFNTHAAALANQDSTTTNFAADDIIYWTITDAAVLALLGGDSVEIQCNFEDAVGDDCATDAFLRTVSFEYV